jgi:Cu+-exporting ATPase
MEEVADAEVKMKKIKINIDGMHCASCAGNIERSLKKVSGVKEVSVSVIGKKAFVEIDERTNQEELKKAVARAGYKVLSIE